jgi:hypothetical protein
MPYLRISPQIFICEDKGEPTGKSTEIRTSKTQMLYNILYL